MYDQIQAPLDISCPITHDIIEDPMIISDGFTYERSAIQKWLKKNSVSPMLGTELENNQMKQNKVLSFYVQTFKGMRLRNCAKVTGKPKKVKEQKENYKEQLLTPELQSKLDSSLSHYYMATLDLKDCCKKMQELYTENPYNFDVILNYANILRFATQFPESEKLVQVLHKLRPSNLIPLYMKIRILSEMGKKEESIKKFEKTIIKHRIQDHTLLEIRFMSYSYLSVEHKGVAEKYINAYILLVPKDPRALSHNIYIQLLNENYKKVVKLAKEYLNEFKDDVSILFHQAKAYNKINKTEKAKNIYIRISTISTDKSVKSKALYETAILRNCSTEFTQMVKELEESHKLDPQEEADGYLAALYADKKMYDKAEEWIEMCSKRTKIENDSVYLGIRAQIQEHKKDYTEAINSYIKLAEIDSANNMTYNQKIEEILSKQTGNQEEESDNEDIDSKNSQNEEES